MHTGESIKSTPEGRYSTPNRVQISLRVSINSSSNHFRNTRFLIQKFSMFIYYHYTICFYPLNLVLGISSHLGRVTIVRDSTISGQQSHSFRIIKDFLSGQSFRQRICQIVITSYVMFSNNTVHTTVITYCCNIGSIILSIVVKFSSLCM